MRQVYAKVDLGALRDNVGLIQKATKAEVMGVVKADAYGHGAVEVARVLVSCGVRYLAVACLSEAKILRQANICVPILILGLSPADDAEEIVAHNVTQTVATVEMVEALDRAAKLLNTKAKVHLKIDSGMGRIGISPADAGSFARKLLDYPNIMVEGAFSHFATSDEADKSFALEQLAVFQEAVDDIQQVLPLRYLHLANSAAILDLPEAHFNMVRAGIILYGMLPSRDVQNKLPLSPVLSLCAKISYIKTVPEGTPLSYGRTYYTERESRIATLPVGYADGYTRAFSGKAEVLLNGQRAKVVGRICMDQCLIDVTDIPAKIGDEAVLYGTEGLTTDEVASFINTINYELPCMLSPRVPKVFFGA